MTKFEEKLIELINTYCTQNDSKTPDFILADFVMNSINAFNNSVILRDKWYEYLGDNEKKLGENK